MDATRFLEILQKELNAMVIWKDDAPVGEFWEAYDIAKMDLAIINDRIASLEQENERLRTLIAEYVRSVDFTIDSWDKLLDEMRKP